MEHTILHCDCNGFFASVECILNPALATVPMAVAGNPENRHGIILAKNELA
ncbi:MAG: DNA polymerase IV, partial [Angelakisella sp.]